MKVSQTELDGVLLIEPTVHHDSRGRFFESYAKEKYRAVGIQEDFIQDNQSLSNKNVLRGLHYRIAPEQFLYKVSEYYSGEKEKGLIWNDPDIGIDWPISDPILSNKDKSNPRLRSL
jgi:dTDP-4-dehydrorhamnose 3,5-epimerase-like enzyme